MQTPGPALIVWFWVPGSCILYQPSCHLTQVHGHAQWEKHWGIYFICSTLRYKQNKHYSEGLNNLPKVGNLPVCGGSWDSSPHPTYWKAISSIKLLSEQVFLKYSLSLHKKKYASFVVTYSFLPYTMLELSVSFVSVLSKYSFLCWCFGIWGLTEPGKTDPTPSSEPGIPWDSKHSWCFLMRPCMTWCGLPPPLENKYLFKGSRHLICWFTIPDNNKAYILNQPPILLN